MLTNRNLTIASLFSCGGLVECGAIHAGFKPIWGVEFDPAKPKLSNAFADCYELNFGAHVIRQRVQDVGWTKLESPDILWASPVCTRLSTANTLGGETSLDLELAHAIALAINTLRPMAFCLENVRGYHKSKSLQIIRDALYRLGYGVNEEIINAADYGVPQSRIRFILRAVVGHFPPPLPPPVAKKLGWFEAIADLISTLPESRFAPWQIQRLPSLLEEATLVNGQNSTHRTFVTTSFHCEPAFSLCSSGCNQIRALLIERAGARSDPTKSAALRYRPPLIRSEDEPCWTIRAAIGTDQNGNNRNEVINAAIDGRVVRLTPRALARLQTVPDWYQLPSEMRFAGPLIGNGVPSKLAQVVLESIQPLLQQPSDYGLSKT